MTSPRDPSPALSGDPVLTAGMKRANFFPVRAAVLVVVLSLAANSLAGDELVKGNIQDKVVCLDDPGQSYALYLPSAYDPAKAWPILYAFDPGGRAREPLTRFRDAAEVRGVIVACSYNSKNGPWEPIFAAAIAMWNDTHARLSIDDRRVFAAGFSGGARAASILSTMTGRPVAGVIACGAGIPEGVGIDKIGPCAFCGIVGTADFNYDEVVGLDTLLDKRPDIPHWIRTFDGTHAWPPIPLCTDALEWLDLVSAKKAGLAADGTLAGALIANAAARATALESEGAIFRAVAELDAAASALSGLGDTAGLAEAAARLRGTDAFKKSARNEAEYGRKEDALLTELARTLTAVERTMVLRRELSGFYAAVDELVETARKARDASETAFARRVLLNVAVQANERGSRFLDEGSPLKAVLCFEIAVRASEHEPARRANMLYNLACAHARGGSRRSALASLRRAVESGFANKALLLEDKDFDALRETPEFQEILSNIR